MKENFYIIIESFHAPDRGGRENVHQLSAEELAQREVHHIDIANNAVVSRNVSSLSDESAAAKWWGMWDGMRKRKKRKHGSYVNTAPFSSKLHDQKKRKKKQERTQNYEENPMVKTIFFCFLHRHFRL